MLVSFLLNPNLLTAWTESWDCTVAESSVLSIWGMSSSRDGREISSLTGSLGVTGICPLSLGKGPPWILLTCGFQLSRPTFQLQGGTEPATLRACVPRNTHPVQSRPCLSTRVLSHHKEEILSRQFLSCKPIHYTAVRFSRPSWQAQPAAPLPCWLPVFPAMGAGS